MNLLDLYEGREPYQQAIDKLEHRRIEDLEARMDDCARRGDVEGFRKAKAERDSYHKVNEAGIGHDIADKKEKIARATPQSKAGAVASTVKNAAKWLAGKGGPGKEGPTYEGADDAWSKEGEWKKIPKSKSGKPVDPRGEVTHLSDVARRETERKDGQKKKSKEVNEESKSRDLAAALMLKKAHAAFPSAGNDAEALALWIADKEQRDVNRLERENEQEEEMIARIIDQLKSKEVDEGWQDFNKVEPYAVCLAGKPVKEFDYYEDARRFHDNWKKKLYREGNKEKADKITLMPIMKEDDPDGGATIAIGQPAGAPADLEEHGGGGGGPRQWHAYVRSHRVDEADREVENTIRKLMAPAYEEETGGMFGYTLEKKAPTMSALREKFHDDLNAILTQTSPRVLAKAAQELKDMYGQVAEGQTDYQKRRQRERDVDAGKPVARQRPSKQTDYQKRRAQDKKDMEMGEEKTRLDPKCWKGKKIGNPKTKMKGGVRVNNCVPAESVEEEAKKGLYYYVNKRKKAGTSRDKDDPRAPSAQDWKDAAKTAKKESVEEEWSEKYKRSIDCSHPKGFSQKAHCAGRKKNEGMFSTLGEDQDTSGVESAIIRRILVAHKDWLMKFGPQKVMQAAEEVAYNVGDVDEIGTSDVSAYVHEVGQILGA